MRHESSKKSKKRLAIVAAVGGAMMASFGVYATTLAVTANQDAAGAVAMTACDPNGVNVATGTPVYDATSGKYNVVHVIVSGIDAGCVGQTLYVTAAGLTGTSLFTDNTVLAADETSHDFTVASPFEMTLLANYAVAIHEQ